MISESEPNNIYIGSYSQGLPRPSLYHFMTKQLAAVKINIDLINPSYVYARKDNIYVVQQTQQGHLVVFDQQYNLIKKLGTEGNDPCHITMNQKGDKLAITNYSTGSFIIFKVEKGIPSGLFSFVMHDGSSKNQIRQQSAHPHSSVFIENDSVLLVADLGTDILYYYEVGQFGVERNEDKQLKIEGSGPRHMALGQNKTVFLAGELDSSLRVISYAASKLELLITYRVSQNLSNYPSQILYLNKTVYLACRGDNYVIIFNHKEQTNQLQQRFRFKVGQWPRHFAVSKAETIYVACQYQNIVQRFKMNEGKLFQMGNLKISCPSCICFID